MTRNKDKINNQLSNKINDKALDKTGNYSQVAATPPPISNTPILQNFNPSSITLHPQL